MLQPTSCAYVQQATGAQLPTAKHSHRLQERELVTCNLQEQTNLIKRLLTPPAQPVSPAAMFSRGASAYADMHDGATRQQKLGNNAALHPPLARKSESPRRTVNDWQPSPFYNMVTCAVPSRRLVRKVRGKS
jgi:hypothetical protein